MRDRGIPLLVAVVALLIVGVLIGQRLWREPGSAPEASEASGASAFREWFWNSRSLDLFVQAGLILCGALGIAALLPEDGEERL